MNGLLPLKLSYQAFESAEGTDGSLTPIIFLHGSFCSKENWDDIPQIVADKTRRKTFAYDARDHGDSYYSDEFNFDYTVDDLFYFMDAMNISKAIIVGHSMGGYSGIRAALIKPERIEMLFSVEMYTKKIPENLVAQLVLFTNTMIKIVQNVPKSMNLEEAKKLVFEQVFNQAPSDAIYINLCDSLSKTKHGFKRNPDGSYDVSFNKEVILKAINNHDTLTSDASGIFEGPAFFLYGSLTVVNFGSEEEHIKKHFPNAELIRIEGATHIVHVDCPEKFVNTILDRLSQRS